LGLFIHIIHGAHCARHLLSTLTRHKIASLSLVVLTSDKVGGVVQLLDIVFWLADFP